MCSSEIVVHGRRYAGSDDGYHSPVRALARLPSTIAGIAVPGDEVSEAVWRWAQRSLPGYLLAHSVRTYCWGVTIGAGEGLAIDRSVLWTASLMHDVGLTRIPDNERCFESEGGEIARRFLLRRGVKADVAGAVATAIVLHMAPSVTPADG